MPAVTVLHADEVAPAAGAATGLTVRRTFGPATGLYLLEQAVLDCPAGRSTQPIDVGEVEETLFVVSGSGLIDVRGATHALAPETGVYLPPRSTFTLHADPGERLRLVAVRVPDPSPGPPNPPALTHLADAALQPATTRREFRIVADPATGLRSATHFVGYIPTQRAPDHFHTYDEVIYVLDGEGVMRTADAECHVVAGSCIQLPARTVHCLENTGTTPMRIVAVFRPAGSPAAAFHPDGTPAFSNAQTTPEEE